MCAHYENITHRLNYSNRFKAVPPDLESAMPKQDLWPGYLGSFIRIPREAESGDAAVPEREAIAGIFGLVPHWAKDLKIARSTYNARSETVASKPSFRDAWKAPRHCIIPADAIYEPDWRSGKAVATRISRADGHPMGIAGLWDSWRQPDGQWLDSYTMLTVNANEHSVMKNFHRPSDEKRSVVVLPEGSYGDWLKASPSDSMDFMNLFNGELIAAPGLISKSSAKGNSTNKESVTNPGLGQQVLGLGRIDF